MIYRFRCKACKAVSEWSMSIAEGDEFLEFARCTLPIHRISDAPEQCLGDYERLIGGTNFILSGKGWARDGY